VRERERSVLSQGGIDPYKLNRKRSGVFVGNPWEKFGEYRLKAVKSI